MDKLKLMKTANEIRKGIVSSVHSAKAGHPGGSLSAADIFTYLYFEELNIDPKEPKKADRDRFVLSKGHTAPGLYSALAERGYFPKEDLLTLRHVGSYLQSRTRSVAFLQSRKICSGRESSIIFINARDAVRRSGFQEAKERSRSVVRSVAQSS